MRCEKRLSLSEKTKRIVAASQKWKCASCRLILTAFFEVDHVHALALGGGNERKNLQALCPSCHRAKTYADMSHLSTHFGKNFMMLFELDGCDTWYRGVVTEVRRGGYAVLFEDGDAMVVPIKKTHDERQWAWL